MLYWRCKRFSPNMRNACEETSFHVSSSMGEESKAENICATVVALRPGGVQPSDDSHERARVHPLLRDIAFCHHAHLPLCFLLFEFCCLCQRNLCVGLIG